MKQDSDKVSVSITREQAAHIAEGLHARAKVLDEYASVLYLGHVVDGLTVKASSDEDRKLARVFLRIALNLDSLLDKEEEVCTTCPGCGLDDAHPVVDRKGDDKTLACTRCSEHWQVTKI